VLEPGEAVVDALPAGADQIDEKRQIVDAPMAFGEQVALEPLQATDCLSHEPAHLGEVASDRQDLYPQALLHRLAYLRRERALELGSRLRERFDLRASPFERRLDRRRIRTALGRLRQSGLRALDRALVHALQG